VFPTLYKPLSNLALNLLKDFLRIYMIHFRFSIYRGAEFVWGEEISLEAFHGGQPSRPILDTLRVERYELPLFESYFLSKQAYFAERIASTQQVL